MTVNRRAFLSLSAAGALSGYLATVPTAFAAPGQAGVYPQDLEMMSVTESSFELSWFTASVAQAGIGDIRGLAVPSDALVRYGTRPDRLDRVVRGVSGTAYHHVEVTGLTPGTTYYYRAESAGQVAKSRVVPRIDISVFNDILSRLSSGSAQPAELAGVGQQAGALADLAAPGVVTTLVPPPGELIATFALSNDLHVGETESGLITDGFPPPFGSLPGQLPYPTVMGRAMLAGVRGHGAEHLIVNGDLTAEAEPIDVRTAYQMLSEFGAVRNGGSLREPTVLTTRGNHDRPHSGDQYRACASVAGTDRFDCTVADFPLPLQTMYSAEHRGIRLIGLDTARIDSSGGTIADSQFEQLSDTLLSDPTQPTLVFGHHPVTDKAAAEAVAGPKFLLDRKSAHRLEQLYAKTPGVFLHHSGHTHRNRRTSSSVAPHVAFLEVASIKEYPGGYSIVRVFEGGCMATFHRNKTPEALQWSEASSRQTFGLQPAVTLGAVADRSFTLNRKFAW